jgi:hypothetical protein
MVRVPGTGYCSIWGTPFLLTVAGIGKESESYFNYLLSDECKYMCSILCTGSYTLRLQSTVSLEHRILVPGSSSRSIFNN